MARPLKEGLEYFPMDVNTDEKLELLEIKYGIEGFGIYVRTLQTIYKMANGQMSVGNEEFSAWKIIGKRTGKPSDFIKQFVIDATEIGLFDKKFFQKGLITSNGIKKRMFEINYLRQKDRQRKSDSFPHGKHMENSRKTLSKVKESKVKESKVNMYVYLSPPTLQEVAEYCKNRSNNIDHQYFIDRNNAIGWKDKNGNPYKDWKAVIHTWEKWNKKNDTTSSRVVKDLA